MKTLYFIGGTMGVGKTSVCKLLLKDLPNSVFLDGDWCWNSDPFQITEETKKMVLDNICFLLNQFIRCTAYENIVFCWVMHAQSIIDEILKRLDTKNCNVKNFSLIANEENISKRICADIQKGLREPDVLPRSLQKIPLYANLNTIKIDTSDKTLQQIVSEIKSF